MGLNKQNSPLLGYNTNVKHDENLFHIQTEDSGVDHPHIITHLFTAGTILATKKTSYGDFLEREKWEDDVRQLMKDQHKAMFVELRDGAHDVIAARILGKPVGNATAEDYERLKDRPDAPELPSGVDVIVPVDMDSVVASEEDAAAPRERSSRSMSIFDTPETQGAFGESLISDKSLDEVILTYLKDELDE
jgi:hypothetical protein